MVASTPRPVIDRKSSCGGDVAAVAGGGDDGAGEGVLAVGLDAAGEAQDLVLVDARRRRRRRRCAAPLVRVPVLSNRKASTVRLCSRARRSLTRIPLRAAIAEEIDVVSGMARPRAWGQEMTSTVTTRATASSASPRASHTTAVIAAAPVAT